LPINPWQQTMIMITSKNPSLADVRARRAEIANQIGSLSAEDKELAQVENILMRLFKVVEEPLASPAPRSTIFDPAQLPDHVRTAQEAGKTNIVTRRSPLVVVGTEQPPVPLSQLRRDMSPSSPATRRRLRLPRQADDQEGPLVNFVREKMTGKETLEELIELMFKECSDDWWTAVEVQTHLTDIKGKEVPMASVSPTLTNMKNKGIIVRDGHQIGLASRANRVGGFLAVPSSHTTEHTHRTWRFPAGWSAA
jgi:hypothetical protein